jgi:hypothetical protein
MKKKSFAVMRGFFILKKKRFSRFEEQTAMKNFLTFILLTLSSFSFGQSKELDLTKIDSIEDPKYYLHILIDQMDSMNITYFGDNCSIGYPPKGRDAINYFIRQMDYQTIRKILKGSNPEGRVYALEALMTAAKNKIIKLTDEDKALMKEILFRKTLINTCSACHHHKSKTEKLFDPSLKRVLYE